jgi:hypothetical protein
LEITEVDRDFCAIFSKALFINFDQKTGWATLWVIFSQTHLVTLPNMEARAVIAMVIKVSADSACHKRRTD